MSVADSTNLKSSSLVVCALVLSAANWWGPGFCLRPVGVLFWFFLSFLLWFFDSTISMSLSLVFAGVRLVSSLSGVVVVRLVSSGFAGVRLVSSRSGVVVVVVIPLVSSGFAGVRLVSSRSGVVLLVSSRSGVVVVVRLVFSDFAVVRFPLQIMAYSSLLK